MGGQGWKRGGRHQPRVRLADEAAHRGHRNVGMPDILAEPIAARPLAAVKLQCPRRAAHLRAAAFNPQVGNLVVQPPLVEQADRLVAHPGCQRGDAQRVAPRSAGGGEQRALRAHQVVQVIEDGVAVRQRDTVVQHQGRHAHQRVASLDFLQVAKH